MTWSTILGFTLPSVVVLLAVYFMFRQYFNHQLQTAIISGKKSREEFTLPMRLQAYERLTLLCERIELADLILRLKSTGSSAGELQSVLLVAVQQEYEHNLTQQLYVSEELWKILILAKNKTMDLLGLAGQSLSSNASGDDYVKKLFELADKEERLPSQIAKSAVKAEASIWL
jgi:hypothetical protein